MRYMVCKTRLFYNNISSTFQMLSVHCAWGRGRTGTMCACYLLHHWNLSPEQAVAKIRQLRPGSIDTTQQESVVTKYYHSVKR